MSKNGLATKTIAKEFIKISLGEKVPTVSELSELFNLPRGTVQNALKTLQELEVIRLETKGHLGSYLIRKNTKLLLEISDIKGIVGTMPLPYSKRYEGLASGLIVALENSYDIPTNLAYMRGAMSRISMVLQGRYDFAIVSRIAAESFTKKYGGIEILLSFGKGTYVRKHVVMLKDPDIKEIRDGMVVVIDNSSLDQCYLTELACKGKNVEYLPIEYSQIVQKIENGEVDAAVMNVDEVDDKNIGINCNELDWLDDKDTEAVLVTSASRHDLSFILKSIIDIDTVISIQKLVLEGKITPSY